MRPPKHLLSLSLGLLLGCGSVCGDGILSAEDEECDDGNGFDDDGCSHFCLIEIDACGPPPTFFPSAQLQSCDLSDTIMRTANLNGANLTDANMSGADLSGAVLTDAIMTRANLNNAIAHNTSFRNASMSSVNLIGADLNGALMANTLLFHAVTKDMADCAVDELPNNNFKCVLRPVGGVLLGPAVDLSGADLRNLLAPATELGSALLVGVDLTDAIMPSSGFFNTDLTNANLTTADLRGSEFDGAILTGATLFRTITFDLLGCDATLPSSDFRCVAQPAAPGLSSLVGPDLTILGADLTGADLSATNLTNMILTSSNLTNANLSGATLLGAFLFDVNITNANLTNADLSNINGQPLNADLAIYSNTTCPNGVNSDNAGGTCVGQGL